MPCSFARGKFRGGNFRNAAGRFLSFFFGCVLHFKVLRLFFYIGGFEGGCLWGVRDDAVVVQVRMYSGYEIEMKLFVKSSRSNSVR